MNISPLMQQRRGLYKILFNLKKSSNAAYQTKDMSGFRLVFFPLLSRVVKGTMSR